MKSLHWILKTARLVFAVFAFALALQSGAFACPLSEPLSAAELRLRASQESTLPRIRGITYDVPGQRVFVSACRRFEYACDLLAVNLRGAPQQEATYLRGASGQYGYTWPSVSPDGTHLAAVRTPRIQRASQRDVAQELVDIDLRTGTERVLANAGDGRFDRIVYATQNTLIAVRSFRSTPSVRCVRDVCTDWAEILLLRDGDRKMLPIEAAGGNATIAVVSLGPPGLFWLVTGSRQGSALAGGTIRRGSTWVLDAGKQVLSPPASRRDEMEALLSQVEREYGSLGGWTVSDFFRAPEQLPFCGTRTELASFTQATLAGSNSGAYVAKLANGRKTTLQVVTVENQGGVPWRQQQQVIARYPSK